MITMTIPYQSSSSSPAHSDSAHPPRSLRNAILPIVVKLSFVGVRGRVQRYAINFMISSAILLCLYIFFYYSVQ